MKLDHVKRDKDGVEHTKKVTHAGLCPSELF
jgi:hypothetical protein